MDWQRRIGWKVWVAAVGDVLAAGCAAATPRVDATTGVRPGITARCSPMASTSYASGRSDR